MDADFPHDPRTLAVALRTALADTPVVCLLGPRQCGKTTLAKTVESDRAYVTLDEESYLNTATRDPDGFVDRLPKRVILDEVQRAPGLLTAIKAPKIHLVDSGLAATLADLSAPDWLSRLDRMGHLLKSFVVQQIHAQAAWTDPDLRFWHYRDKDQVEVDLVITRGEKVWGVEVKASRSLDRNDGKGLDRLAAQCGADFQGRCVLYDGRDVLPIPGSPHLAVPLRMLWDL